MKLSHLRDYSRTSTRKNRQDASDVWTRQRLVLSFNFFGWPTIFPVKMESYVRQFQGQDKKENFRFRSMKMVSRGRRCYIGGVFFEAMHDDCISDLRDCFLLFLVVFCFFFCCFLLFFVVLCWCCCCYRLRCLSVSPCRGLDDFDGNACQIHVLFVLVFRRHSRGCNYTVIGAVAVVWALRKKNKKKKETVIWALYFNECMNE